MHLKISILLLSLSFNIYASGRDSIYLHFGNYEMMADIDVVTYNKYHEITRAESNSIKDQTKLIMNFGEIRTCVEFNKQELTSRVLEQLLKYLRMDNLRRTQVRIGEDCSDFEAAKDIDIDS